MVDTLTENINAVSLAVGTAGLTDAPAMALLIDRLAACAIQAGYAMPPILRGSIGRKMTLTLYEPGGFCAGMAVIPDVEETQRWWRTHLLMPLLNKWRESAKLQRDNQSERIVKWIDDDATLPPSKIAAMLDLPLEPLRARLKRWRDKNHTGWMENPDRAGRDELFIYRVGAIRSAVINPLLASASGERRARKK